MERKLAAILAADIVGYSAQMERDEAGTFARLSERRKGIFEPEIARHGGRIFKTMGDGILAEFGSVVQAVECAVVLQAALEERNRDVPDDQAIRARIGINLGEVIVDGDDRFGEGVNIAARLEQLAETGGICVSDKVAREVEKKLAFGFVPMGPQKVKNIAEPVVVFRVSRQLAVRRPPAVARPRTLAVLAGALLAVALAALALLWPLRAPDAPPLLPREGPLSMAVLRFANLTGDPGRDFLTIALPENIATMLGSSALLRYSEFYFDLTTARPGGVQAVAADVRADLVLDGAISAAAPGVRFTGKVYDGLTGTVVREIAVAVPDVDLARLQYLIAQAAVEAAAAASGSTGAPPLDPGWAETSAGPDEYAIRLRALAEGYSSSLTGEDNTVAVLEAGLARYPQSVILRIAHADMHTGRTMGDPVEARWGEAQAAWALLSGLPDPATLPLQERWYLHLVRAQVAPRATGDFALALRDAEAVHALTPYTPGTNLRLSDVAANAGQGVRAIEWAQVGLNPDRLPSDWQREAMAWALLIAGRPEEALAEYAQVWNHCLPCEVVALVRSGQMDKARRLAAELQKKAPHITIEWARTFPTGRQPFMAEPYLTEYLEDLQKAGIPEVPPPP